MSEAALNIRRNAEELKSWENDIKEKDKSAKKLARPTKNLPPVRGQPAADESRTPAGMIGATNEELKSVAKEEKIKAYDYRSWDKFDVDKAPGEIDAPPTAKSNEQPSSITPIEDEETNLEKALLEKEKGNAWFKKGQYEKAISCYTKSMRLDPSSPIMPVNRAMAYLKLNRFAEAEADCSQGLNSDPKNVKALWRRGIARRELKKLNLAKQDLESALVLEPTNKSVKDEMNTVMGLIRSSTAKPPSSTSSTAKPSAPTQPTRRRLHIEEVGEEDDSDQPILLTPAAGKKARTEAPKPASTEISGPKAVLPTAATKPSSPSKNISGNVKLAQSTPRTLSPIPAKKAEYAVPKSMYEFERDWKSLKNDADAIYTYLKAIDPKDYNRIFKSSLESNYLSKIIEVLHTHFRRDNDYNVAFGMLKNLSQLPRFNMTVMFLSRKEKQMVTEVIAWLSSREDAGATYTLNDVTEVAKAYK
ncbi:uncharacterized protein EV422DRAFT_567428 [Fimicolochytrium jonesii]|uniref:uncharacterized protein n=1 Tax=Fimicolochytrium jonesii TaxID=1396493 RepID=UPI0022FDD94B|nr:uncharacterized protein EV422DRAFT_567428 [Fimicolochytrium jonesii]KAI8821101.1 hypothetical protein EV422DRAFT_567428 [Fimicolochytrium jonesii]